MNTPSPHLVRTERVDDLPVLFASLQQLRLAALLDHCYPTHHLWKGQLSFGEVVSAWLVFLVSQGDHCLVHRQTWAAQHQLTLQACLGKTVRPLDFHDDRLADILDALACPEPWQAFETELDRCTCRVYALEPGLFRLDTTTASSYADVLDAQGLLQFGHSKDRDDLPQLKVAVAALDPLGLPVSTVCVPGNCADDPLYVPAFRQVQAAFGAGGKTYVGDCKMAALATRAYLVSTKDYYLCPLSESQLSAPHRQALLQAVWQGQQPLSRVERPAAAPGQDPEVVAEGFAVEQVLQSEVDGVRWQWTERRWLVRSMAFARAQQGHLERRLQQATAQLQRLNERKQGKKRLDAEELHAAATAVVQQQRVERLLDWRIRTSRQARRRRRYGPRPAQRVWEYTHQLEVARQEEAIAQAQRQMGWQVYATNHRELDLTRVVWGYRGQYRIEDDWSRLKGRPLSLTPMYLQDEGRMQGLVLLLSLAVRLLTLLEWVVRQQLAQRGETLRDVYPGQAGRQTRRPSAELLLRAFQGISLTVVKVAGQTKRLLTPLSPVQKRLLVLWGLPANLYHRLTTLHFPEPPPFLGER